jgi:hypothetical protein
MLKTILTFALSAAALYAQTGTIDYVMGLKNKPELDPRNYVFTRTNGAGASGTLTSAGAGKTATLSPCPAGITAASIDHSYVRISAGTGTAEAVQIVNYAAASPNCTITFTTANTHSGSWVIGPNGNGLQEALIVGAATSRAVHAVAGVYTVYAPVYLPPSATIRCDGPNATLFQAQTASIVILDAAADHNTISECGFSNLANAQGTTGNAGLRLGTAAHTISVPLTTQTSETHSATAVSGGTTLTLTAVSAATGGAYATYSFSAYSGTFPDTSMSFSITGFTTGGNNVTATPSVVHNASNTFSKFTGLFFDFLYDDILSINANQWKLAESTFYDPTHSSVVMANPLAPDSAGGQLVNNMFFSYVTLGSPADAFILIHSTSSVQLVNNNLIGSGANINYCVSNDATTSGGWMNVTGNKCENTAMGFLKMNGTWTQLAITGNVAANSGGLNNWNGIQITGTGVQYRNTIGPNVIQCGGTGNKGVYLTGTYQTTTIDTNTIMGCDYGIWAGGSPTGVLIGPGNNITTSATSPVYAISAGIIVDMVGPFTYAQLTSTSIGIGSVGNGSRAFCSECNSTVTAGSSTGRTAFRENNIWTH